MKQHKDMVEFTQDEIYKAFNRWRTVNSVGPDLPWVEFNRYIDPDSNPVNMWTGFGIPAEHAHKIRHLLSPHWEALYRAQCIVGGRK